MNFKESHSEWSKRMLMDQTAVKDPYNITTKYEPEEIRLEKLAHAVKEIEAIVSKEVRGDKVVLETVGIASSEDIRPKDPRLNWDELQETVCQIIETFEDFLDSRGITIDNPEKNDSTDNPKSNIYGTDYGELQSYLELIFVDRGLVTQEIIDKFK